MPTTAQRGPQEPKSVWNEDFDIFFGVDWRFLVDISLKKKKQKTKKQKQKQKTKRFSRAPSDVYFQVTISTPY